MEFIKLRELGQIAPGLGINVKSCGWTKLLSDVEHKLLYFGCWGVHMERLFGTIADSMQHSCTKGQLARLKGYWRSRLSFVLLLFEARAVLARVCQLSKSNGLQPPVDIEDEAQQGYIMHS